MLSIVLHAETSCITFWYMKYKCSAWSCTTANFINTICGCCLLTQSYYMICRECIFFCLPLFLRVTLCQPPSFPLHLVMKSSCSPPSFPSLWKSAAPASHQHVGLRSAVRFRPVCVVVVLFFFLLIIYVSWWPSTLSHPFSFYFSVLMYSIFRIRVSISHTFIILSHHFCIHFPPPCVVLFINYNLLSVSLSYTTPPQRELRWCNYLW